MQSSQSVWCMVTNRWAIYHSRKEGRNVNKCYCCQSDPIPTHTASASMCCVPLVLSLGYHVGCLCIRFLTLGSHAQRGLLYLVCVCVYLSVCLSVHTYSRTTHNKAAKKWYQRVQCPGLIFNPRRACAARVTVLGPCVGRSVCLSVYIRSRTTGYETAHERY